MLLSTNGISFIDVTNDAILTNADAFKNQIQNLITIPKASFPFQRDYGFDLEKYLFMNFGFITANFIQIEIENQVFKYFDKIQLLEFSVTLDQTKRSYEVEFKITHPILSDQVIIKESYVSHV